MHVKYFNQFSSNLFAENKLLKFGFVVLLLIVVSNWQAINTSIDKHRTIIVPIGASGDLWVTGDDASDNYLRHMARYISSMVGNYTASSARYQFEELLSLYSPSTYAEAKTGFEKLSDDIERYPTVSSRATWLGRIPLFIDGPRKKMTIKIMKDRLVNGDVTRSVETDVVVDFYIADGRFWIKSINTKDDKTGGKR